MSIFNDPVWLAFDLHMRTGDALAGAWKQQIDDFDWRTSREGPVSEAMGSALTNAALARNAFVTATRGSMPGTRSTLPVVLPDGSLADVPADTALAYLADPDAWEWVPWPQGRGRLERRVR